MRRSFFWRIWLLVDVLFVLALSLRLACEAVDAARDPAAAQEDIDARNDLIIRLYNWYEIVISINVLFVCLTALPYYTEWKTFGILLIMVQEMMSDVVKWLLLFVNIFLAFSFCLLGFERAGWYVAEGDDDGGGGDGGDGGGGGAELANLSIPGDGGQGPAAADHPITMYNGAFWAPFWVVYGDLDTEAYKSMLDSGTGWLIWVRALVGSDSAPTPACSA